MRRRRQKNRCRSGKRCCSWLFGHRFFSRRELLTTTRELVTISSAEMMGCSTPDTASGSAMRLYEKAQTRFCLMMEKNIAAQSFQHRIRFAGQHRYSQHPCGASAIVMSGGVGEKGIARVEEHLRGQCP